MAGGTGLTATTAAALGLLSRGKLKPTLGTTGMGAAEGALTANIPEALDLAGFQPIGGPGWQKTLDQTLGKENLVKTGAEAFIHGSGAGALSYGTSFGPKVIDRVKSYFARPPSSPPAMLPSQTPTTGNAPPLGPSSLQPQSPPLMIQGSTGLWHYGKGSGKTGVVPKHLWPRPEAPPPLIGE